MPTIVGILTLMSRINFLLSRVEYEKRFIASGLGYLENFIKTYQIAVLLYFAAGLV